MNWKSLIVICLLSVDVAFATVSLLFHPQLGFSFVVPALFLPVCAWILVLQPRGGWLLNFTPLINPASIANTGVFTACFYPWRLRSNVSLIFYCLALYNWKALILPGQFFSSPTGLAILNRAQHISPSRRLLCCTFSVFGTSSSEDECVQQNQRE